MYLLISATSAIHKVTKSHTLLVGTSYTTGSYSCNVLPSYYLEYDNKCSNYVEFDILEEVHGEYNIFLLKYCNESSAVVT